MFEVAICNLQKTGMHRAKALAKEDESAQQLVEKGVARLLTSSLEETDDHGKLYVDSCYLHPRFTCPCCEFSGAHLDQGFARLL